MTGRPCLNCGRPFDEPSFPLGRRRKDGTRHPMSYCEACLALPTRIGGGLEARRRGAREYMRRRRSPRQIRLPGVCIDCRAPVMWTGKRWQDTPVGRGTGRAHRCAMERAA